MKKHNEKQNATFRNGDNGIIQKNLIYNDHRFKLETSCFGYKVFFHL